MGGNNSKENLVKLTAREHFICHVLLTKMTEGVYKQKMIAAAIGMKRARHYQYRYINSRLYESMKIEYSKIITERNKNTTVKDITKQRMSEASLGKKKTPEHAKNISNGLKGKKKRPKTQEEKDHLSEVLKGRPSARKGKTGEYTHTQERKDKIAENNRLRGCKKSTKQKISDSIKKKHLLKKLKRMIEELKLRESKIIK